jgi:hypothetical protein
MQIRGCSVKCHVDIVSTIIQVLVMQRLMNVANELGTKIFDKFIDS